MPRNKETKQTEMQVAAHIKDILKTLGYDLRHPDLKDTPKRVMRVWIDELFVPKPVDRKLFRTFPSPYKSMVTLRNYVCYTRCPHHLERVQLLCNIAYIPAGRLIGLSKLARIAAFYSRGLMLQEEITEGIAEGLNQALKPKGVAVFLTGHHMCMTARGIKAHSTSVVTSSMRGVFLDEVATREEFLRIVREV